MRSFLSFVPSSMIVCDPLTADVSLTHVTHKHSANTVIPLSSAIKLKVPFRLLPKLNMTESFDSIMNQVNQFLGELPYIVVPPGCFEPYPGAPSLHKKPVTSKDFLKEGGTQFLIYMVDEVYAHSVQGKHTALLQLGAQIALCTLDSTDEKANIDMLTDRFILDYPFEMLPKDTPLSDMTPQNVLNTVYKQVLGLGFAPIPIIEPTLFGIPEPRKNKVREEIAEEETRYFALRRSSDDFNWTGRFIR